MKPSDVLDKAAEIIIRDGWYQGEYFETPDDPADRDQANRTAPCCQAGAISRAAHGVAWLIGWDAVDRAESHARYRAERYMRDYIRARYGTRSSVEWNDTVARDADEVVTALRGAAEEARRAGQ